MRRKKSLLGLARLSVGLEVDGNALVAPSQMRIEFLPLRPGALQRQPGQAAEFVEPAAQPRRGILSSNTG